MPDLEVQFLSDDAPDGPDCAVLRISVLGNFDYALSIGHRDYPGMDKHFCVATSGSRNPLLMFLAACMWKVGNGDLEGAASAARAFAEQCEAEIPVPRPAYRCSSCGATGVKLWREYVTFHVVPKCRACTELDGSVNRALPVDEQPSLDNIGWWVPAIPTTLDDEKTHRLGIGMGLWWGYSEIPPDRYAWWKALPETMEAPSE